MSAKPTASPVQQARDAMHWLAPTKRPMCGNCKQVKEELKGTGSLCETSEWRCGLGHFATLKQAVCDNWEADKHGA